MQNIAIHGRIAVCGRVSAYDSGQTSARTAGYEQVVYRRVRIQGFVLGDSLRKRKSRAGISKRWRASASSATGRSEARVWNLPRAFLIVLRAT